MCYDKSRIKYHHYAEQYRPCAGSEGATTNADSNGVELIQGSRTYNIQIVDNYIHTDTFAGNQCTQQQHTGIMDQSNTSGTANLFQGNVIAHGR